MLKRYWFVLYPEWRYGPLNVGVTAISVKEAKELILLNFVKLHAFEALEKLKEEVEVIEDVYVRLLDEHHVIPNIGPVTFRGVWFPRMNL